MPTDINAQKQLFNLPPRFFDHRVTLRLPHSGGNCSYPLCGHMALSFYHQQLSLRVLQVIHQQLHAIGIHTEYVTVTAKDLLIDPIQVKPAHLVHL